MLLYLFEGIRTNLTIYTQENLGAYFLNDYWMSWFFIFTNTWSMKDKKAAKSKDLSFISGMKDKIHHEIK